MTETTKPKPFCFVLMPFSESFDDTYELGIKAVCKDAGAYCERVDEQIFNERILDRVYNQISKADIIIADMTGRNANVFYEVGYAHALGKRTILLTQNTDDIPFDLKDYPHIIYGGKITDLKEKLTKRVEWFIANPNPDEGEYKLGIELYVGEKNISLEKVEVSIRGRINLTLFNSSVKTYSPDDIQIGIIAKKIDRITYYNKEGTMRAFNMVKLPNKSTMHMISKLNGFLFPETYHSLRFNVVFEGHAVSNAEAQIKIFTKNGTREYPITFTK